MTWYTIIKLTTPSNSFTVFYRLDKQCRRQAVQAVKTNAGICFVLLLLVGCLSPCKHGAISEQDAPLLAVTPEVARYSEEVVSPRLRAASDQDDLAQLLLVSKTLIDPRDGISVNMMPPGKFMSYNMLSKFGLGVLSMIGLSPAQKQTLCRWRCKYMQDHPADVFFAPSADEIIRMRAAFGCTHYARAFIAVVKALGLVREPGDLRYVISSKSDDYDRALAEHDLGATINGHQFVIVRIGSRWIAINTSKGESIPLPTGFDPDSCIPPRNISIQFPAYPDITFLIRRIGADWDDGCGDNSLSALMNISRSGDPDNPSFLWEAFALEESDAPSE